LPIALEVPPRDPAAELRSRLERAPAEHAEALLAAYEVLQALHEQGVLDILRAGLSAKDQILEMAVSAANTPEAIRAIRNLLFWRSVLGGIEPEWFKGLFQAHSGRHSTSHGRAEKAGWAMADIAEGLQQGQPPGHGCRGGLP
jgi:uncharacterized protein YjgD (DUF1641 family)